MLASEAEGRFSRKRKRNYASAHFPPGVKPIDEFDPGELEGGITATQIECLKDLDWLDSHGNVVLAGPPGLGKTMIALGLGLLAIDSGYTVAFEKMESFIKVLDDADVDRKAGFRLRNLKKCQLVIVDEIGYTPITKQQANRFFSFVSDAYERTSMVFKTNKEDHAMGGAHGRPGPGHGYARPHLTSCPLLLATGRVVPHQAPGALRGRAGKLLTVPGKNCLTFA